MADKTPLAEYFVDAFPDAAARVLEEHPPTEVSDFVDKIPDPLSGKALSSMLPYHAARCLQGLADDSAGRYLATLTTQRVTSILRHLPPERRRSILDAMPRGIATRVGLLLNHSVRTVGAWMDPAPPAVPGGLSVADALVRLRDHEGRRSPEIFLIDGDEKPVGVLALADLVWSDANQAVSGLASPVPDKLVAATTLVTASRHVGWRGADRLPVVDRGDRLIGVLRHAALRSGIERVLEAGSEPTAMGDPLDLANFWYQGLADTLNAALAHVEAEADIERTE